MMTKKCICEAHTLNIHPWYADCCKNQLTKLSKNIHKLVIDLTNSH